MNTLVAVFLRSRIGFLCCWIVPLVLLLALSPAGYRATYPDKQELEMLAETMRPNLGTRVMYGITPDPLNYATWTMWELWIWIGLLGGVMAIMLAVRLTRAFEEDGILEITRVSGIPRRAPVVAAAITLCIACGILGLGSAIVLYAQSWFMDGFGLYPSILTGLGISLCTATYGAVALIAAQVTATARGARGLALGFLGISYVIRVIADVYEIDWLRWCSPLGWRDIFQPFIENHLWPLGVFALIIVMLLLPPIISTRDLHEHWGIPLRKFITSRQHQDPAAAALEVKGFQPTVLQLHGNRSIVGWWMVTIIAISTSFFALVGEMNALLKSSPSTAQMMQQMLGTTNLGLIYVKMMGTLVAILLCSAAIQTVLATSREEHTSVLNLQLTCGNPRHKPLLANWAIAILAGSITVAISALTSTYSTERSLEAAGETVSDEILSGTAWAIVDQIPAIIAFTGITVLCIGISGRRAWLAWLPLAYSGTLTYFGDILNAPQWLLNTSALAWAAHGDGITATDTDYSGAITLIFVGLFATAAGAYMFKKRDLLC